MAILTLREIGDPILRKRANIIEDIKSHHNLYNDMIQTLEKVWWVWIAAPQIGESLQVFIVRIQPTKSYPDLENKWPQIIINPTITAHCDKIIEDREWCLSVPWATPATGLKGKVPRYQQIQATRYDENGNQKEWKREWFAARVFQHEYDHLQWIFFLDRMISMETLCTSNRYQKSLNF